MIAGRLGVLAREWDETGGLDPAALAAHGPLVGSVRGFGLHDGLRIETVLDPKQQPFLRDHRIEGTPVLPGVMGIESFAEAAALMLPGFHVESVERIDFHAPFKFYRDAPRALSVTALLRPAGAAIVADCRLTGVPEPARPGRASADPSFQGTSVPGPRAAARRCLRCARPVRPSRPSVPRDLPRLLPRPGLPRRREGLAVQRRGGRALRRLAAAGHRAGEGATLIGPRLIELCFQTAGSPRDGHPRNDGPAPPRGARAPGARAHRARTPLRPA